MDDDLSGDILKQAGFRAIGALSYRLDLRIWWNAEHKIQVVVLPIGATMLVKGSKAYYLKAITEEGATWARDIGPLHDYLEHHFPEMHLSFSFFRDITPTIAAAHIGRKLAAQTPTIAVPTAEHLARLQAEIECRKRDVQSTESLLALESGGSSML